MMYRLRRMLSLVWVGGISQGINPSNDFFFMDGTDLFFMDGTDFYFME